MEDGSEEEDAGEENAGGDRKGNGEPYEEVSRVISGDDGDEPGMNVVADDAGGRTGGPRGPSTAELAVGNPGVASGRPRPVSGNWAARAPGPAAGGGGAGGGPTAGRHRGGSKPEVPVRPSAAAARSSSLA